MKKVILNAAFVAAIVTAGLSVQSCSNNDNEDIVEVVQDIDPNNFQGDVIAGKNITLDANKTYILKGKVYVKSGATLTIPAGTNIVGVGGTASYLIVDRGGKIFINGTADKPVVFRGEKGLPGEWGGLVILGNAPSNRSASGESTSELGDLIYGGSNAADNSGSISFAVIKDSGAKYNESKEFNGLSLFGVGNGTNVNNVYVVNGADDGIEFFGGTVNASNLIVNGVGDDSFDWTEGWNGQGTNWYAKRRPTAINGEIGNRGIEADNQDTNPNASPTSNPTLKNVTLIGSTEGSESQGAKLRAGTNGNIDNLVIANFSTGLDIETDKSLTWFTSGGKITNVKFVNVATKSKGKNTAGASVDVTAAYTENENATGAGNGIAIPTWANWAGIN